MIRQNCSCVLVLIACIMVMALWSRWECSYIYFFIVSCMLSTPIEMVMLIHVTVLQLRLQMVQCCQ